MSYYNEVLLNSHLRKMDRVIEMDIAIDKEAREQGEILIQSAPNQDGFDSIMEFISGNDFFITQFNTLIHSTINNASVESVENLQKFMFEMAYEVARKKIEKSLTAYQS